MSYPRTPWTNRFAQPSVDDLLQNLIAEKRKLAQTMRELMLELRGVRETVAWYGDPWRWSIEYRTGRAADEPLTVLVPNPEDLQLAMAIDRGLAENLHRRKLKKTIREGLDLVRAPFQSRWGVWTILTVGMAEELRDLADVKLQYLGKATG